MDTERHYIFTNTKDLQEGLTVYPEKRLLSHWLNKDFFQRLGIVQDPLTKVDYLEYDRFKSNLWVGLLVRSSHPGTDLHDFFLGKHLGNGRLHGIYYVRGNPYPVYFSQEKDDNRRAHADTGTPIDWNRMGKAKKVDLSRTAVAKFDDPNRENSFVARLIAAPFAPAAEVSLNNKFEPENTIMLDSAHIMDGRVYEYLLTRGLEIVNAKSLTAEVVGDFCEELQIAFSEYFPMQ